LAALQRTLDFALAQLREGDESVAQVLSKSASTGEVFSRCRDLELRLAWVQRLWVYFRDKLDQRDGDTPSTRRSREVLEAADDIIWSCYAPPFRYQKRPLHSAPLAYIAPLAMANAATREDAPDELESDVDATFLNACLEQLPMPLIGLPPSFVDNPWWLVLVAHETGHHVQNDLTPGGAELIKDFAALLQNAVKTSGVPNADATAWFSRGKEVFADIYSVLCVGPAAIQALAEMILSLPETMLASAPRYPAPLVRLRLLAEVADQLGVNGTAALPAEVVTQIAELENLNDPEPEARRALVDLKLIPHLAKAALNIPLGDLPTFPNLMFFDKADFLAGSSYVEWAGRFAARKDVTPASDIAAARWLVGAAFAASIPLANNAVADPAVGPPKPADETFSDEPLRSSLLPSVVAGREPGLRALGGNAKAGPMAPNPAFADLIVRTPAARLRNPAAPAKSTGPAIP
jgi:hypothetical protein